MPSGRSIDGGCSGHIEATDAATPRRVPAPGEEQSLGDAYQAAWDEWAANGGEIWDATVGDGLLPEDWSSERANGPNAGT
ncbi:MAG: hypothetical protein OXC56_01505 [Chloroflexi bacterium]|nr:hypothetical protein [Chloroflexota bacterium]